MIHMEPRHLKIVQQILAKYPYNFYVYGSRSKGNPKKFSDLDLCFKADMPNNIIFHIEEEFEESDLPFTVDIVDYNKIHESFRSIIDVDLQLIPIFGTNII